MKKKVSQHQEARQKKQNTRECLFINDIFMNAILWRE